MGKHRLAVEYLAFKVQAVLAFVWLVMLKRRRQDALILYATASAMRRSVLFKFNNVDYRVTALE